MREWKFENGIEVYENDFDYDLHRLKVYNGKEYLGTIFPASTDEMIVSWRCILWQKW